MRGAAARRSAGDAVDAAILRREQSYPDLEFRLLVKEPLEVFLPSDHRLAKLKAIAPQDIVGETFLNMSGTAPVLRVVIDDYLNKNGIHLKPSHDVDNLAMAMSLIASTRGIALIPAYGKNFVPWSVTSRPLQGEPPTIDLVVGYRKTNPSPVLKLLLSRLEDFVARVSENMG